MNNMFEYLSMFPFDVTSLDRHCESYIKKREATAGNVA